MEDGSAKSEDKVGRGVRDEAAFGIFVKTGRRKETDAPRRLVKFAQLTMAEGHVLGRNV